MNIIAQSDDALEFVQQVEQVANGVILRHAPVALVLVKIDNWFGSNWLGFSGKAVGAIGIWNKPYNRPADDLRIPPFVPNRVVSQRKFSKPTYEEVDEGGPIHRKVGGGDALRRKIAKEAPGTAFVWYSGNSKAAGRGAVMVYAPVGASCWPWYAALDTGEPCRVTGPRDIKRDDLASLMGRGSAVVQV